MLETIFYESIFILVLLLANGFFAMTEIAVLSARKPRLEKLANAGNRRAAVALHMAKSPERILSTVQIGITLIGVAAGAFGGATIAEQLDQRMENVPALAPYSEAISFGVVVVIITYLSLVIGELVPKRLALNAPERIASAVAPFMHRLSRLGAPAVALLMASTNAVLALLRVKPSKEPAVTEDELRLMLHQASDAGAIPKNEREIVERVFRLGDRRVNAMMTPRVDIEWLDIRKPLDALREQARISPHSRLPVCEGDIDRAIGILSAKDLWASPQAETDLRSLVQPPLFVPENTPALSLLERFRESRNHVALVLNEFGGVVGFVTPSDILQALVGELPEPHDYSEPALFQRDDGSWSIDAATDIEEVRVALQIPFLKGQKEGAFQTIAGYVIDQLGHIPRIGEKVEGGGYRFEIADMDGLRVDRLLATPLESRKVPGD